MKITINGKTVELSNKEVKICRNQVADVVKSVKNFSKETNSFTYYYTFLIMMHVMSQSLLNDFDSDEVKEAISAISEIRNNP